VSSKDFRGNVIRRTNRGISHDPTRLSPIVDDTSITDSEVDLVEIDRISVTRLVGFALEQLLIVRVVMKLMEAS